MRIDDIDNALGELKAGLRLLDLRRQLRDDPSLNGEAALAMTHEILTLQAKARRGSIITRIAGLSITM